MKRWLLRLIEPRATLSGKRNIFSNADLMQIIIRFVRSVILGVWMDLGVIGVAAAMCCDWMVRAVLFLHRFRSGQWKRFQVIEEKENTV